MTQIAYRATLSNAMWPQRAAHLSSTVVSPQYESLSSRKAELPPSEERDIIAPQVYYVENALPTNYGFESVLYATVGTPVPFAQTGDRIISIAKATSSEVSQVLFALSLLGDIYIMPVYATAWIKAGISATYNPVLGADRYITAASMNDKIVVAVQGSGLGLLAYNPYTQVLSAGPLGTPGLESVEVQGVFSTTNYLAVWDTDTIYWSAFENPLDFVPSEITGAGNGVVMAGKGRIRACVPTTLGFIIYCEGNAIAALSTSRADEPFTLREISGSGGVSNIRQVVADWNAVSHYAYTSSGLAQITNTDAKPFITELTDLIVNSVIDYVTPDGQLVTEFWEAGADVQVTVIKDRYLCVSYKNKTAVYYTWCFVYDTHLKRAGKLKRYHLAVLEYYGNLALMTASGQMSIVRFGGGSGIVALGKYQHIRQRMLSLDAVAVDKILGASTTVTVVSSLDGFADSQSSTGYLHPNSNYSHRTYTSVGTNHKIVISGEFSLQTVVLHYHIHGRA